MSSHLNIRSENNAIIGMQTARSTDFGHLLCKVNETETNPALSSNLFFGHLKEPRLLNASTLEVVSII